MEKDIFPWIEEEEEQLKERQHANPKAIDLALQSFLEFLRCLRRVLLQDLAVIHSEAPSCNIYAYHPFNTPSFHKFAAEAPSRIAEAERKTQLILKDLPERYIGVIQSMVRSNEASQEELKSILLGRIQYLEEQLISTKEESSLRGKPPAKRQRVCELLFCLYFMEC